MLIMMQIECHKARVIRANVVQKMVFNLGSNYATNLIPTKKEIDAK